MFHRVGYNDIALLVSLVYFCIDLRNEWDAFTPCVRPIHRWLFASWICAIFFRLVCMVSSITRPSTPQQVTANNRTNNHSFGDLLLDMHVKGNMPRALATFTWTVVMPFFTLWTFLGTSWLYEVLMTTPKCLGSLTPYLWFAGCWLLLCYYWIMIHAVLFVRAWRMRSRLRSMMADYREIEDEEVLHRWGRISNNLDYNVVKSTAYPGMSPAAIKALPASESVLGTCECPICLCDIQPGDAIRCLPGCNHTFHRSCIDPWLVRRAECPLCKQQVGASTKED